MTSSPAAPTRRIQWQVATVVRVREETRSVRTLEVSVPGWSGHVAGQHVDVRLTAADGYQAQRSYSIASPPEESHLSLTIEMLKDGEVSTYLCGVLHEGDQFELRGPIGGHFVWDVSAGGPLLLVGGGSGIVPLMAMLRHRAFELRDTKARHLLPARLLYSSRNWDDVIYRDELEKLAASDDALRVVHTITREAPHDWKGFRRRIDREMLTEVAWPPTQRPRIFVCGPTPLVESVATTLVDLGHPPELVKTERFGPTGS